jgi:hypothetical protein
MFGASGGRRSGVWVVFYPLTWSPYMGACATGKVLGAGFVVCLLYGFGKLVCARGKLAAAGIAAQCFGDVLHSLTFQQLGNHFEVAIAAASEFDIGNNVVVDIKFDEFGTNALSGVCIMHKNLLCKLFESL